MLKEYIQSVRSLSIIGMCKNAGKTTVLNKLIAELNESRVRLGLTSIGRDGESTDLVTRTAKPGIYVYEGTLVATAVDMFRLSDITREIIYSTGWPTPWGGRGCPRPKRRQRAACRPQHDRAAKRACGRFFFLRRGYDNNRRRAQPQNALCAYR